MSTTGNILFSGVGGQGILLASEITAYALLSAGYDAKKSEVHGMAQRGGSIFNSASGLVRTSPACSFGKQQCLNFFPLPQGHCSFLPIFPITNFSLYLRSVSALQQNNRIKKQKV